MFGIGQLDKIYFLKIFMLSGTDSFKLNDFDDKIKKLFTRDTK